MAISFKQSDSLSQVNMTPMIDCVFQLLLFFMLASQFKDFEDKDIPLSLPSASEAQPLTAESPLTSVQVNQAGEIYMQARKLTWEELDDELHKVAANNRLTARVRISADKNAKVDAIVQVINLCIKAQIRDYTLTTAGEE